MLLYKSRIEERTFSDSYYRIILTSLILAIISIFIEHEYYNGSLRAIITTLLEAVLYILILIDIGYDLLKSKKEFSEYHSGKIVFLLVFTALFVVIKINQFAGREVLYSRIPLILVIIRNILILLKTVSRAGRFGTFIKNITDQPARTIILSFLMTILTGTVLLMLPFSTTSGKGITFIDSLFTVTSAVCVTGLTVVDTAKIFTVWGQVTIMILIQIGGLSIMALSYFVTFLFRQSVSITDRVLLSYMLSEDDVKDLWLNLRIIIVTTFIIEIIGALCMAPTFISKMGFNINAVFYSFFHAVSAFCNAGFALYSDNLESFKFNIPVNLSICGLIILGGISFPVIKNILLIIKSRLSQTSDKPSDVAQMSVNTKVVLSGTLILIVSGTLFIYLTELDNGLAPFDVQWQYLAAFFQSVTLRTAGFNTINMSNLHVYTYLIMIVFMFVGGASASTAGGVKINAVSCIIAYVKATFNNQEKITLFNSSITKKTVLNSFLIFFLSAILIIFISILLSFTEKNLSLIQILFEAVSGFCTVGLSTGITSSLTSTGKFLIVVLMFIGRVGPLTFMAAASRKTKKENLYYSQSEIIIG